jgi:hypothetical protein
MWKFKEDVLKEIGVGPVQRMKYFDAIDQMKPKKIKKVTIIQG